VTASRQASRQATAQVSRACESVAAACVHLHLEVELIFFTLASAEQEDRMARETKAVGGRLGKRERERVESVAGGRE